MSDPAAEVADVLEHGGDADDALRNVVAALVRRSEISWAGIAFIEEGALRLGPAAGRADESRRLRAPVSFQGASVGELWVDGTVPADELDRVAALIAPLVLIGWDTGGEAWDP